VTTRHAVTVEINGQIYRGEVEPRLLLCDFIREDLGLLGTHVGCEHGVCGACTILWNGEPARSCLAFAVQVDGATLSTVEGMAISVSELHPIQQAFTDAHALQCGFCTPGILMTLQALLTRNHHPSLEEIREWLSGNLCRCTGYQNILAAAELAAKRLAVE
jgi:carbon-monoxide dehydrogenase small subunit